MSKLTLISFLTAITLTAASAEGMFSMSNMMKEMTDAAKKIKTEVTDTVTDIKEKVTDTIEEESPKVEVKNNTSNVKSNANRPKDAAVTESIDLAKN